MLPTILGIKKGMTQIFLPDGACVPVTVVEAGPMTVLQVKKSNGTDKYDAIQVGFQDKKEKATSKPMKGHFAKSSTSPKRYVREIRTDAKDAFEVGQKLDASIFKDVQKVDVIGVSKGKGWQGTIKLWNFGRQRMSHGNSVSHRHPGSLGRHNSCQGKGVPKGFHMAGHMGDEQVTVIGLKLTKVDVERNLLLIKGAVPGATGGLVMVRQSLKQRVALK